MITDKIRRFIEEVDVAFVASADAEGTPHLAAGMGLQVTDPDHLAFEAWFCTKTLDNVAHHPRLAIAVTAPKTAKGYQFIGTVEKSSETAILDGFVPGLESPGLPQVCSRLEVRVETIMEFSARIHSDTPLAAGG